jgi:metal-responsive CopG/Arc/MetJ family transcriptional regulator
MKNLQFGKMGRKKLNKEDKKPILTVNINENLLNKIDKLLEQNGELRSRLVEKLLEEYIEKNKDKLS